MKRVVITGVGCITPLGNDVDSFVSGLEQGKGSAVKMEGWDQYNGLRSLVAAPAELKDEKKIPRQKRRSMGRLSIFAAQASDQVIADSGIDHELISSKRTGCIIGSTMGGAEALNDTFALMYPDKDLSLLKSMNFFQCVSHTAAMNTAQYLGITGTVAATSAACASSLQSIGMAYDLIRTGQQDRVLCGGSEEVHPTVTGSFDILYATSSNHNDSPDETPKPFDANRDGLVCGEGAGIIMLEEYDQAVARGAKIYAEVTGYNTCGSGEHVSQSNRHAIEQCIRSSLSSADMVPADIDYISAHATATTQGDIEEAAAIGSIFGDKTPVSSLKGHIGHTLGASGAIELIASLIMMQKGMLYATRNLETVDEDCKGIQHVLKNTKCKVNAILKNCFAFGGINASLICKKI